MSSPTLGPTCRPAHLGRDRARQEQLPSSPGPRAEAVHTWAKTLDVWARQEQLSCSRFRKGLPRGIALSPQVPRSGTNPLSDGRSAPDLQSWKTLVADLLYLGASGRVPHNVWSYTGHAEASVANQWLSSRAKFSGRGLVLELLAFAP